MHHSQSYASNYLKLPVPHCGVDMSARVNTKQGSLLALLRSNRGGSVSLAAVLAATGWKASAWRVYCTNGLYSAFLQEESKGVFKVHLPADLTDEQFALAVSQSRRRSPFKHALSDRLVERAKDNFALALECYNRPTLDNRIDAFALLCVTAWEQLLKARWVEKSVPHAIFRPQKAGHRRESVGLTECIAALLPDAKDPVRRNLEEVAELRHEAAHLAVRDLQGHFARVFQACVFNFSRNFRDFTGKNALPGHSVGLLALASEPGQLVSGPLEKLYGQVVAHEILDRVQRLAELETTIADDRFAIPVEYTLSITKHGRDGDVQLVSASAAPLTAVVFSKPTDPDKESPYRAREVCTKLSAELGVNFRDYDLQTVLAKEGWKKSDNEFHHLRKNPDTPKYSERAVEMICTKVRGDATYLQRCRDSYSHTRQKGRQ